MADYRKSLKRVQDTLVFKGLSFVEAYLEGRARIAVEFCPGAASEANARRLVAVWHNQRNVADPRSGRVSESIQKVQALNGHNCTCRNQTVMFVRNVEPVNAVDFIPIELERLYFVEDEFDGVSARQTICFLSFDGGFRVLPRVPKGELCVSPDNVAIGLDKSAVSVIKGSAKIVDRIPDDGRGVAGDIAPQGAAFPFLRIGLRPDGFEVVSYVGPDNKFKLVNVIVGPFYF